MKNEERARWTVLVVDDDDTHRYATQRTLESRGFRTLAARDGREALAIARQADAVVLDVHMPDMSGLDVCVALRELDQALELVVIQYSGVFISDADKVIGLRAGADAYLTKGSDGDLLVANLDAQLRKRDRLRRLEAGRLEAMAREERARDLFMSVLGHDLRGPMQTVMMSAEVLRRSRDSSDQIVQVASRIVTAGDRITGMLDDLRDYALVRMGGGLVLNHEPVDLAQLLRSCIDEAQIAHPAVRFVLQGTAPHGWWDRAKLFRVVLNLLRNAVQHGTPGEPVTLAVQELAGSVVLRIVNAGTPGSAVDLGSMLEARLRRDASEDSTHGNLGLGLFICKQIVEAHGGRIEMTVEDGATTVTLTLPLGS